ncbi:T-cell ecto-ADP-ribosyltransferase 1-like [Fundulus diaphanus]
MATLAMWTAVLLLFGSCIGTPLSPWTEDCYPLDMAPNSVDDMYDGYENKMDQIIKPLLNEEKKGEFGEAWTAAENYYILKTMPSNTSKLKKNQIMAVHAYTLEEPPLYVKFNEALRTQKHNYKAKQFKYHAMHFFLTMALRSLNHNLKCVTSYRRTDCYFKTAINSEIRFGAFTSSTEGSYPPAEFGEKSCFEIYTCFGADISKFSEFFFCFFCALYKLESTKKTRSELNCALTKKTPAY